MKKLLILSLILGAAAGFDGRAQVGGAGSAAPVGTWTLTPAYASQYMFRGVRLGGDSFQPALDYSNGPWSLGVWSNVPIADEVPGQSDPEFDFYSAYTLKLADAVTLVPGFTWYVFPDAERSAGFYRSTFEPNVALNYTVAGLRLTPKVYYDATLKGATYEIGAFYAVPLTTLGTELDFSATIGTFKWRDAVERATPRIKNWGDYWQAGVSLPFQLSVASKVSVGWFYAKGDDNFYKQGTAPKIVNGGAVGRGVVMVSYAMTF